MLIIYDCSVWKIINGVVRNNIVNRFHYALTDIILNDFSILVKKWHIIFFLNKLIEALVSYIIIGRQVVVFIFPR